MGYITRNQILESEDLERAEVPVPEWGGTLLVRELTGEERGKLESSALKQKGSGAVWIPQSLETVRARVVAMGAIDESGKNIFTLSDIKALAKKSGKALERAFKVISALSGIGDEEIAELTANFGDGPSGGSGSI